MRVTVASGLDKHIPESLASKVFVERGVLLFQIGHQEVGQTVVVKISGLDAHARAHESVGAIANAGFQPNLLEFLAFTIHPQKIGAWYS